MQVKKFEAPTIQEALETIKRELGPEAIILQTKQNKKGFGLLSKASVEVTAAISEKSFGKKQAVSARMSDDSRRKLEQMPAAKQSQLLNRYASHLNPDLVQDKVSFGSQATRTAPAQRTTQSAVPYTPPQAYTPQASRVSQFASQTATQTPTNAPQVPKAKITATRYIDIDTPQQAVAVEAATQAAIQASGNRHAMEGEISSLKRMILELQSEQARMDQTTPTRVPSGTPETSSEAFEQLLLAGVDKKFAYSLIKKAAFELQSGGNRNPSAEEFLDQVAMELLTSVEVLPPFAGIAPRSERSAPAVIALVGPTGVGKTTTVAKIAALAAAKRGWKVGLINLDQFKVAAFDQLATYARLLQVPFRSVSQQADLKSALQEFDALDLILIDTTGRSQKDPAALQELKQLLSVVSDLRTHLVVSATTRDAELYDMASRFAVFRPQGISVSKLDEATHYGAIYNVSAKAKLPLLFFTTGQRVPEDIEEATQERVAALVLDL